MTRPHDDKTERISTKRTYLLLSGSLLSLLEDTPFEKITLTRLCSRSLVPRSTFYRYFEDKYDLLHCCFQTFFDTIRLDRDIRYLAGGKGRTFVTRLIAVIDQNRTSFQKIFHANKNGIFMDLLRGYLLQTFAHTVGQIEKEGRKLKISQPVFAYLLADLYISMAKCYLESEDGMSPETFANDVCLFAMRDFFE